jgi:hypothetical protein
VKRLDEIDVRLFGTLNFTGEPTPESLYGAGTRVFLEIAAESVPCANPPLPNTRCLQYRERHFHVTLFLLAWRPQKLKVIEKRCTLCRAQRRAR